MITYCNPIDCLRWWKHHALVLLLAWMGESLQNCIRGHKICQKHKYPCTSTWIFSVAFLPLKALVPLLWCQCSIRTSNQTNIILFIVILLIVSVGGSIMHWFYYEPGGENPYKIVLEVIKVSTSTKCLYLQ